MIKTEILKNRPFALFCAAFMFSSGVAFFLLGEVKLISIAVLALALICAIFVCIVKKKARRAAGAVILASVALILGALISYSCFDIGYMGMRKYDGRTCRFEGVVTGVIYDSELSSAYEVRLSSIDGEACDKKIYFECEYDSGLQLGYAFSGEALFSEPRDTEYGYYKKMNVISDGMTAVATSESEDDCKVTDREADTPELYFKRLKADLSARLSRAVGGEAGDLASAVFLADRSGLDDKTELDFSRSGISHMLALSGLHMGIVTAAAEFFFKKLYIRKTLRCILISVLLILYLTLIGFALSAVRSVIMVLVIYLAYIFRASNDSVTSLFFAGFIILLISPTAVCDVGFWMSFFATLGIVITVPYLGKLFLVKRKDGDLKIFLRRILRYFISALTATLAATFSILVFLWAFFGEVSLISPITNIIISPLLTFFVVLAALTLGFYAIEPLSGICAEWCASVGNLILDISAYFSDLRGVVMSLRYEFAGYIICAFWILTLVFLFIKLKHKFVAALPSAAAVLSFAVCLCIFNFMGEGSVQAVYLREKSGEELVLSENGKTVICDMSEGYYSRLKSAGEISGELCATEIEVLILTHYHPNHAVGVAKFFDNYKTRALWLPEPQSKEDVYLLKELIKEAEISGVEAVIYKDGAQMKLFGEAELKVFPYRKLDRSVEAQVGFSFGSGGSSLTYISSAYGEGDIPPEAEKAIYESDVLIIGAHGPREKEESYYAVGDDCKTVIVADRESLDEGMIKFFGTGRPLVITEPEYFTPYTKRR